MPRRDLDGLRVLVTRPTAQSQGLSEAIRQLGGDPVELPLLEIIPLPAAPLPHGELASSDLVVFVSANAVEYGLAALGELPVGLQLAAIGQATSERLAQSGYPAVLQPAQQDSEGFLGLPQIQELQGRRVVIVRGQGGREKLAEGLRARGAQVEYLEVYRRQCPAWDAIAVSAALTVDVITISSGEALENLARLAQQPGAAGLLDKPLLVFHARIAGRARELGFTLKPVVATAPADEAVVAGLIHWMKERKGTEST